MKYDIWQIAQELENRGKTIDKYDESQLENLAGLLAFRLISWLTIISLDKKIPDDGSMPELFPHVNVLQTMLIAPTLIDAEALETFETLVDDFYNNGIEIDGDEKVFFDSLIVLVNHRFKKD